MRVFWQALLWSIAAQLLLIVTMSPQGDLVPNHLFAFATAPAIGVAIATVRHFSAQRTLLLMLLAYTIAISTRILWLWTSWWNYDLGLPAGMVAAPIILLLFRLFPKHGT